MAKGQKRSGHEQKKPKWDKPEATAASRSPFPAVSSGKPAAPTPSDKK